MTLDKILREAEMKAEWITWENVECWRWKNTSNKSQKYHGFNNCDLFPFPNAFSLIKKVNSHFILIVHYGIISRWKAIIICHSLLFSHPRSSYNNNFRLLIATIEIHWSERKRGTKWRASRYFQWRIRKISLLNVSIFFFLSLVINYLKLKLIFLLFFFFFLFLASSQLLLFEREK